MKYKHRIADQMLAKKLASKGAILIEGPKFNPVIFGHGQIRSFSSSGCFFDRDRILPV